MIKVLIALFLFVAAFYSYSDNSTYLKGPMLVKSNQSVVSSGGTIQLNPASQMDIAITGVSSETIKLPNTASVSVGVSYNILNKSTQNVVVQDFGGLLVDTVYPNTDKKFILFSGGNWLQTIGGSLGKTLVGSAPIVVTQDSTTATLSLGAFDFIDFNTATTTSPLNGRLFWDQTNKTLAFNADTTNSVVGQINQELWVEAINNTGSQINDGQVVYINGASGSFPTVALATAANYNKTIGVATQNIANGAQGKITMIGAVSGYNTSGFSAGDILYLSDSVAGALTATRPASNIVQVAKATDSLVSGKINVHVMPPTDNLTLDPTGFLDPSAVTVSYNQTTRKITLTGTFKAVWKGSEVTQLTNGWESVAHDSAAGKYYLYYNGTSFVWSTNIWTFDMLQIATVDYDGVNNIALRECHGIMNYNSHEEFHRVIGTFLKSGADLSGYTLANTTPAERRPLVSSAIVLDEDLPSTIPEIATESYSLFSLTGTGTASYSFARSDIVPVLAARPYYNQFSSPNWIQTLMTPNYYQAIWLIAVPVTSDVNSQKYRYLWVQGQSEHSTVVAANNLTPADINLNGLVTSAAELVYVAKVVIQYVGPATNNWRITSVSKLTGSRYNQTAFSSSSFLSSVSTDASFTGNGSTGSPLALSGTVTTTGYHYYGTDADNSFRVYQSAGALITEKKVSGLWVEVSRIDNL